MRKEQELVFIIRHPVLTMGDKHCSNDCPHLDTYPTGNTYTGNCALFDRTLPWDKACKYHGYLRCNECTAKARLNRATTD